MSYKPRDNQKIAKHNQLDPIRKTILRNPEVAFGSAILSKSTKDLPRQQPVTWHKELSRTIQKPTSSRIYHEPRLNKLADMRKSLNEIKSYEAKTLEGVHDLTKNSQRLVNREISSKLNFPSNQPVFKNLTKLYGDESSDAAHKAEKLIQKSARKVSESSRKSVEIREDINELIEELVELEYEEGDQNQEQPKHCPLPGEDDYLGTKSSSPVFFSSKKKLDRHFEMLEEEIMREFFKSDDYLQLKLGTLRAAPTEAIKATKSCKCLDNFYTEHSSCA